MAPSVIKIVHILFLVLVVCRAEIPKEYIERNDDISIDLFDIIGEGHKNNYLVASYSLDTLLSLITVGANGETGEELKKVLNLPSSQADIIKSTEHIIAHLKEAKDVVIERANKIYLQSGFDIEQGFLETAKNVFDSDAQNINFTKSKTAAEEINSWVDSKTNHKIKSIVQEEQLTEFTRMILLDAFYFKGQWQYPFEKTKTQKRDFKISENASIQVDTMEVTGEFCVDRHDADNLTFIRLPYGKENKAVISLTLYDDVSSLNTTISQKKLKDAVHHQTCKYEYVKVFLPKFRIETSVNYKPYLEKLGINKLFTTPDLSGITKETVKVDAINQRVFMDVNEDGTEAGATTAAIIGTRTALIEKKVTAEYHFNQLFTFCLLYDEVCLILGRVANPLEKTLVSL